MTGRHARRVTGATRWGLRVLAYGIACGVLVGVGCAVTLGTVLGDWAEGMKTVPVEAVSHAP